MLSRMYTNAMFFNLPLSPDALVGIPTLRRGYPGIFCSTTNPSADGTPEYGILNRLFGDVSILDETREKGNAVV